ncbi:MAG: hypothetical protein BWY72_00870 [Bacteroidetes bacterium ADurb.Bin416]|nr:MAG: hypothetical protein BWY72_00870 [Bacteroidetes bacterium ADurb.Bin416]
MGEFLDGSPHLPDLLDGQLGLVEQDEMFGQVFFVEQDVAIGRDGLVPSCPTGFLYVIFQGIGDFVVHHQPHVFFIHPHTKG